ncbi:MAG: 3-isopropylmalate dehydratase small subunit [Deltaproteobacteria bacterium]|jgi:3-isopropylmalate/(R)-2-methylmalate dehydratase small subunit|nr:3-isopropylmalate dehydratase small subunit [Deltaproteobacteria bacterium]
MKSFTVLTATAAALDRPNIDTDLLIPKQFLTRIERTGYGPFLFYDLRFDEKGVENPEFLLNHPENRQAQILLARENFGCGSSREHAVWALDDFGFRVIIAPSFGDIFRNNSLGVGLLLIELPSEKLDPLMAKVLANPGIKLTVDLTAMTITGPSGAVTGFEMESNRRERYLGGLDAIGLTLKYVSQIEAYEKSHAQPWEAALPKRAQ